MVVLFRSTNGCFAFFSQFGDKVTAFFWVVQVFVKKYRLILVNIGKWGGVSVGGCQRMSANGSVFVRYLFGNGSVITN